jgi:hypothetical protein
MNSDEFSQHITILARFSFAYIGKLTIEKADIQVEGGNSSRVPDTPYQQLTDDDIHIDVW